MAWRHLDVLLYAVHIIHVSTPALDKNLFFPADLCPPSPLNKNLSFPANSTTAVAASAAAATSQSCQTPAFSPAAKAMMEAKTMEDFKRNQLFGDGIMWHIGDDNVNLSDICNLCLHYW